VGMASCTAHLLASFPLLYMSLPTASILSSKVQNSTSCSDHDPRPSNALPSLYMRPALVLLLRTGFPAPPSELPHWLEQHSQSWVFGAPWQYMRDISYNFLCAQSKVENGLSTVN
jgi:hypothetical protein